MAKVKNTRSYIKYMVKYVSLYEYIIYIYRELSSDFGVFKKGLQTCISAWRGWGFHQEAVSKRNPGVSYSKSTIFLEVDAGFSLILIHLYPRIVTISLAPPTETHPFHEISCRFSQPEQIISICNLTPEVCRCFQWLPDLLLPCHQIDFRQTNFWCNYCQDLMNLMVLHCVSLSTYMDWFQDPLQITSPLIQAVQYLHLPIVDPHSGWQNSLEDTRSA